MGDETVPRRFNVRLCRLFFFNFIIIIIIILIHSGREPNGGQQFSTIQIDLWSSGEAF